MKFPKLTNGQYDRIKQFLLMVVPGAKVTPPFAKLANNYIPLIVTVLGAILGILTNGLTLEAIVYGAVSGLASTGLHQVFTQLLNIDRKEG